jgi:hypothetical protein
MQRVNGQYYLMLEPLKVRVERLPEDLIEKAMFGQLNLEMMCALERNAVLEKHLRQYPDKLKAYAAFHNVSVEMFIKNRLKDSVTREDAVAWRKQLELYLRREYEMKRMNE